jgi:tetratricopeptide (TPR) repeat protein
VKFFTGWSSYVMLSDLAADDGVPVGGGYSDRPEYWDFHEFELTSENSAVLNYWIRNYYGIYRANIVINEIPLQTPNMDLYRAEAKFLRSYFYSELVKCFGNIAFYSKNLTPTEYRPANVDKSVVYAQIEKDLQEAIQVLPKKSDQTRAEYTRASKGAAQALLGKVYLYEKKYDDAASMLNEVITSGEYGLCPVYDSLFKTSEEFGIESVFEIPYSTYVHGAIWGGNGREIEGNIDAQQSGPRELALGNLMLGGWGFDMIDSSLIDAFDAQGDVVRKYGTGIGPEFFKKEITDPAIIARDLNGNGFPDDKEKDEWTGWYQIKRTTWVGYNDTKNNDISYGTNERIIRFADVLLMYAEAMNRKSSPDDSKALTAVNQVRARAKLNPISSTGNQLFEDIKIERRLELGMEGHRYWDVVRWGDGKKTFGYLGFVEGKYELWPIPQTEIGQSNLVQNPGY